MRAHAHAADSMESMQEAFVKEEGKRRATGSITLPPIDSRKLHDEGERSVVRVITEAPPDTFIVCSGWEVIRSHSHKLKEALQTRQHHGVTLVCLRPYFKLDPRSEETWLNLFFLSAARDDERQLKKDKAREQYRKEAKVDITEKVVKAYMRGGRKIQEIAETLEISESTVRRILKKNTAAKIPSHQKPGSGPTLPDYRRYDEAVLSEFGIKADSVMDTAIRAHMHGLNTDRTRLLTSQSFKRFFKWLKETTGRYPEHPDDVRPIDIENYKSNLEEHYRQSTLSTHLYHLKGFFRFCVDSAATNRTPFAAVRIPRAETSQVSHEPLEREDIQKLTQQIERELKECEDAREYDLTARMNIAIQLFRATGARISSILNIRIRDIKFKKDRVEITLYLKGGRQLLVVLGPKMAALLKMYIAAVFKGKDEPDAYLIFRAIDRKFEPMTYDNFRTMLIRLGKRAGVESRVTTHRFRASFATHNKEDGMDEDEISKRLGHKRRDQTNKYFILAQKPYDPAS